MVSYASVHGGDVLHLRSLHLSYELIILLASPCRLSADAFEQALRSELFLLEGVWTAFAGKEEMTAEVCVALVLARLLDGWTREDGLDPALRGLLIIGLSLQNLLLQCL